MRAINCTLYPDNPYQSLLYSGLGGRYDLVRGTVDQALTALNAGEKVLLHVNWEEHVIRASPTKAEAQATTDYFLRTLKQFVDKGGRVVWTIHNEFPHELQHPEVFVACASVWRRWPTASSSIIPKRSTCWRARSILTGARFSC